MIVQINDAINTLELAQKINLASVSLDDAVVGILQGHALESKHFAIFGRHPIHLGTAASAETLKSRVARSLLPAVKRQEILEGRADSAAACVVINVDFHNPYRISQTRRWRIAWSNFLVVSMVGL